MAPPAALHHDTTTTEIDGTTVEVPNSFICPITLQIMVHPVMTETGLNFERSAIISWLEKGTESCPLTRKPLRPSGLVSNKNLQNTIWYWKKKHGIAAHEEDEALQFCLYLSGDKMEEIMGRHLVRQQISLTSSIQAILIPEDQARSSSNAHRPRGNRLSPRRNGARRLTFLRRILTEAQNIDNL
jgi:hypothetical protein